VIATTKSLIEFKRESSKLRGKNTQDDSDSDRDWDKSPRRDTPTNIQGQGKDKND